MTHDAYRGFAAHYDLHGWDWFGSIHGPRLIALLEERGLVGGRVLDAGCGTGTLALALAARGFTVTGLDLSQPLLDVARKKDAGGSVHWVLGDLRGFDLTGRARPFDAVTCVADTLNHLDILDDWEAAFRRFAAHLRPGGSLFLDVATLRGLQRMDKQSVSQVEEQALILAVVFEPASRRSTLRVTSFRRVEGQDLYERAAETISEWGQSVAAILERLERTGFEDVMRPWAAAEDAELEDRLVVVAKRR